MTPVEQGRTSPGAIPRRRAASAQIRSAASTPPGAHTFEILLLMTIAAELRSAEPAAAHATGAPGKAFLVNTAAKSGEGLSSAIRVSVILEGFGASAGVKSSFAVADAEARGERGVRGEPRAVRRAVGEVICVLDMA